MYSNQPIISYNKTQYCPVNAELKVIRTSGPVAIVEDCHNFRFPCLVEMLSDNEVVVIVDKPIESQLTLF